MNTLVWLRLPAALITISLLAFLLTSCGRNKAPLETRAPHDYLRELDAAQVPAGVDPEVWRQLKTALRSSILAANTAKATASAPTQPQNKVTDFRLRFTYSGYQADCYWPYINRGDYDLNGEVNINDLTALGVHFKKRSNAPDWDIARLADGDENGEVNIADITPLGVNLGHQIGGYVLQRSKTPDVENSWQDVDPIAFDEDRYVDYSAPMNRYYCYDLPGGLYGNSYRVVPYAGDGAAREFGIPSNIDFLPAYDIGTQGQNFLVELNDFTSTLPAFDSNGNSYAGSNTNYLYSIDPSGAQRWKYLTNGNLTKPAAGADDTIYAGCEDGTLYAMNPDGSVRWTFQAASALAEPSVGADGRIYVGSADRNFYCLNEDGSLAWSFDAGLPIFGGMSFDQEGTAYFYSSGSYFNSTFLIAVRPDGTEKWRQPIGDIYYYSSRSSAPMLAGDGSILSNDANTLVDLDAADGSVLWTYNSLQITTLPLVGPDSTIYIGASEPSGDWTEGLLLALNPDGSEKWRFDDFTNHYSNYYATLNNAPVMDATGIYFESSEDEFIGLDLSGSLVTRKQVDVYGEMLLGPDDKIYLNSSTLARIETNGDFGWQFGAAPGPDGVLFGNGQVYASTRKLSAFDQAGTKLWDYSDNFQTSRSPIAMGSDGLVYAIDDYGIIAAVRPDGTTEWHGGPLQWIPNWAPTIGDDGSVYVTFGVGYGDITTFKERLTAFDDTGSEQWHKEFDFYSGRTPALDSAGNIYLGGTDGGRDGSYDSHLIALRPNGTEIWEYETPLYTGSWFDSPILFGDGHIYLQGNDYGLDSGALIQLDLDGYELGLTKAPVRLYLGLSHRPDGSILSGGYQFACAQDSMVTTFNSDGSLLWNSSIRSDSVTTPVSGPDGSVYLGAQNGNLYALNPDGSEKWVYHARSGFSHKPAVAPDGTVYALDESGVLYSIAP